jgi:uncharacterized membrane protein HdeD (DUF308 family)
MRTLVEAILLLTLIIFLYQFYSYAVTSKGEEKQKRCQATGIISATIGMVCLVYQTPVTAFAGLILMMFGFRLIAHGLDRIDKNIFIDRYQDDDTKQ